MLAVRLASLAPDRISHLLLEDPIGLIDYRLYIPPQSTATLEKAEREQTPEAYRAFVARYFPKLPPAQYETFVTWRLRMALSGDYPRFLRVVALTYQMIYHGPVRGLFGELKPPVLLLVGDRDASTPLAAYAPPDIRPRFRRCTRRRITSSAKFEMGGWSNSPASAMSRISKRRPSSKKPCWIFSGAESWAA